MQKIKSIQKDMTLLKSDVLTNEALKTTGKNLEHKAQLLLLWSMLCCFFSYLALIVIIARIYLSLKGRHPVLLTLTLLSVYCIIGILIFAVWKSMAGSRGNSFIAAKSYIKYQISKLFGQRKLTLYYILEYSALISISCCFFYGIPHAITLLLKLTVPVSVMTYVLGFYYIVSCSKQIKKLRMLKQQTSRSFLSKANLN